MKNSSTINKLAVILFATLFLFSFTNKTYAATTLCEEQINGAADSSKSAYPTAETIFHLGLTGFNLSATNRCILYTFFLGDIGQKLVETPEEALKNASTMRGGIAGDMFSSMYSTFNAMPTANIPGFYASMLLPKEFQEKTGSVFAVDCTGAGYNGGFVTKEPACKSTYNYWSDLGLSKLWSISFTIAMIAVVGVLVAAGFMVMLRNKIKDGQKIISVSVALQNVVVAAVFSLMSFALGAFFVNLSKFLTLIVSDMFSQLLWQHVIPGNDVATNTLNGLIDTVIGSTYISNPLGIFFKFIMISFVGDVGSAMQSVGSGVLGGFTGYGNITSILSSVFFFGQPQSNQWFIKSPLYIISRIIAAGVLFYYSLRIWATTLGVFLNMAFDTITAPLVFVMSAIPGKQNGISNWFKKMIKNALNVPLMFALVNVAAYVVIFFGFNGMLNTGVVNPLEALTGGYYGASGAISASSLVTDFAGVVFAGVGPAFLLMLLILSFVPKVPEFMDEIIKTTSSSVGAKAVKEFGGQVGLLASTWWSGGTAKAAKASWTPPKFK